MMSEFEADEEFVSNGLNPPEGPQLEFNTIEKHCKFIDMEISHVIKLLAPLII
jgi:hypothetical protein